MVLSNATEGACIVTRSLEAMHALSALADDLTSDLTSGLPSGAMDDLEGALRSPAASLQPTVVAAAAVAVEAARGRRFLQSLLEWPRLLETTHS